jgi:hypothetical protein
MDFTNGIKAPILFQRKSGDSATCFGNTLIAILAISRCMNMENMICGYFVGDDESGLYDQSCRNCEKSKKRVESELERSKI